jgi:hypothetical protein
VFVIDGSVTVHCNLTARGIHCLSMVIVRRCALSFRHCSLCTGEAGQRVVRERHVACGERWKGKTSFNLFFRKAEAERAEAVLRTYELYTY